MRFLLNVWLFLIAVIAVTSLSPGDQQERPQDSVGDANLNYLPVILNDYPIQETVFGIQAEQLSMNGFINQIDEAGAYWVRTKSVDWASVEPIEGARDWGVLLLLDNQILAARDFGLEPVLTVKKTPGWAQAVPPFSCGKILPEKLDAFANFMYDLVSRYSASPYEVRYWEIWNEPDVAPSQVSSNPDSPFGCWGDEVDPNFGGDYFADMLSKVYPKIKSADPNARVILGGLLLDCDPRVPNACPEPLYELPSKFLAGILSHHGANDGKDYFDSVAYHAYDHYQGNLGSFGNQNWVSSWNTNGPVVSSKASFVFETLSSYGAGGKFIMNTENALICDTCSDDPVFELTKAYYIAQSFAESISVGLKANIWFSILGWRNSGLVNPDLTPRLGFTAYKTTQSILQNPNYLGPITVADVSNPNGIAGYKFDRSGKLVWVIWSLDGANHQVVLLDGAPDQATSILGQQLPITQNPVITLEPIFLIWN